MLRNIDTSPVGFAMFDQVLLSVHPDDCTVRDAYAARLLAAMPSDLREGRLNPTSGTRLPASPADLMLRVVNLIVDGFLDLRRELSRQLDHWQTELLRPRTRFANWGRCWTHGWPCMSWTKSAKTSALPCRTGRTRWRPGHLPRARRRCASWTCSRCAAATCWNT